MTRRPLPARSIAAPFAAACLGIAIFSAMDVAMKHLSIAIGAYNAILWRTLFSLPLLAPIFLIGHRRWPPRPVLLLHVGRGLAMAISLLLFFWGLARVPLALGVTLGFISPLVALTLAGLFLGERIARATIAASVIAFCGVLVILSGQPREVTGAGEGWGHCAILAAAILYAVGTVIGRPLAQRAAPIEVALVFNIVAATVYLFGAPWLAALPAATHFPTLLFAATTSGASIMLLAWAYARAETQYLVPVEYTAFLWAALFGWFAFGEPVTPATLAGAILIVAGCLGATRSGARARSAAT